MYKYIHIKFICMYMYKYIHIVYIFPAVGPFAQPDVIHVTGGLPKTRSGKIMRRSRLYKNTRNSRCS